MISEDIIKLVFSNVYTLEKAEKEKLLLQELNKLINYHKEHCDKFSNIIKNLYSNKSEYNSLEELPFLPVRLFKMLDLKSILDEDIFKVLSSSGTSGNYSKIFLDRENTSLQTKALASIMKHLLGNYRLPMIIIDSKETIKNRFSFNARGAGIIGFSTFGRDHFYLLNEKMEIDFENLKIFLEKHKNEKLFIFGFTYMIWEHLYKGLKKFESKINLENSIILHGGGWKKLNDKNINNNILKKELKDTFGANCIYDYYGMVEQIGSIFIECDEGYLHAPSFADVIIREANTLKPLPNNQDGLIQDLSILPHSYPGNSLLTEDIGRIIGNDDCPCKKKGKYIKIKGRMKSSEARGCSDSYNYN